jgi:hypothetical protein
MNDNTQTDEPTMNGNDELAKALAGGLKFEETPAADAKPASDDAPTLSSLPAPTAPVVEDDKDEEPTASEMDHDEAPAAAPDSDLDKIKSSALDDLKPLVGKLNLSPEEKFDTLLLIIRSTDDQSLLAEAHAAAKGITDDTKRAEALLDVIKEVDYFNSKKS